MKKKVSNKQKNQPYNTRVSFDDKIHIARNKTSVPPLSQGAVDGAVKYKPITENFSILDAQKMVGDAIGVIERHIEHHKNSPNGEILNSEELFRATEALEDGRIFDKFDEDDLYNFFMWAEAGRKLLNNKNNINEKKMNKIRVNESTLRSIIKETIKRHLSEFRSGEYSSSARGRQETVVLEKGEYDGDLIYQLEAKVTIDGDGNAEIDNLDLVEGSYNPDDIDAIEVELVAQYGQNVDEIIEKALESSEDARDNTLYGEW